MGRGRAKAKQTKVARELKYRPVSTDLNKLRAELSGDGSRDGAARADGGGAVEDLEDDPYAAYVPDDDDGDDPAVDGARSAR